MKWVPWDPNYQKVQIPCFLPFSCYKPSDVIIFPEEDQIHKRLSTLFQFSSGTWGHIIAIKFTIPHVLGPLQEKL